MIDKQELKMNPQPPRTEILLRVLEVLFNLKLSAKKID